MGPEELQILEFLMSYGMTLEQAMALLPQMQDTDPMGEILAEPPMNSMWGVAPTGEYDNPAAGYANKGFGPPMIPGPLAGDGGMNTPDWGSDVTPTTGDNYTGFFSPNAGGGQEYPRPMSMTRPGGPRMRMDPDRVFHNQFPSPAMQNIGQVLQQMILSGMRSQGDPSIVHTGPKIRTDTIPDRAAAPPDTRNTPLRRWHVDPPAMQRGPVSRQQPPPSPRARNARSSSIGRRR